MITEEVLAKINEFFLSLGVYIDPHAKIEISQKGVELVRGETFVPVVEKI